MSMTTDVTTQPKRRRMTQTQKIRRMLNKGVPPREVAARLNVSTQAVHNVRHRDRKKQVVSIAPPAAPVLLSDLIKEELARAEQPPPVVEPTPVVFVADTSAPRYHADVPTPTAPPAPTVWQRVLGWFGWR